MYCKMYVIANGAILKKKNVCKILVELYSAILVRFSIFSIQVALIINMSLSDIFIICKLYSTEAGTWETGKNLAEPVLEGVREFTKNSFTENFLTS